MVEFGSAWNFLSKDWNKTLKFILFGALMSIIPVVGQLALMGVYLKVLSNVVSKKDEVPEVFDNFGNSLVNGLKFAVFSAILMLPLLILAGMAAASIVPVLLGGGDYLAVLNVISTIVLATMALTVVYAVIMPGVTANYAKLGTAGAFFDIGKVLRMVFSNFGGFIVALLVSIVYSVVVGAIGGVISFTVVGAFLLLPASLLIGAKIWGDWYAENSK